MRALFVTGLMIIAMGGGTSRSIAQPTDSPTEVRERIKQAFEGGGAEQLLTPAADRVEISILGMQTYYSRDQALYVLQDFFKNYAPRQFAFEDVSRAEKDFFATAQYWYGQAERPLQVYVRLTQRDEAWILQEIRLDRSSR